MSTQPEYTQSDQTLHRRNCCQGDPIHHGDMSLWQVLQQFMTTPAQCVALVESFVYGFTPRAIRDRHPQLFPDIQPIYLIKLAVIDQAQAHPELFQLFDHNS